MQDYQSMLDAANQSYKDTLAGYQSALSGMQAQQAEISQGYNTLQANVLGGLAGASKAASQEVADRYAWLGGKTDQQLISAGLGNTTVRGAMARGVTLDHAKAQTDVANTFANTAAGYQTNLGLAGLGYRANALGQQSAWQGAQLGYMGAYGQLQQQQAPVWAQINQQDFDRLGRGRGYGGGAIAVPAWAGGGSTGYGSLM